MADALRGAIVLEGRWGLEQLVIAIPTGRDSGMAMNFVRAFVARAIADGQVKRATERAGLRGTLPPGR